MHKCLNCGKEFESKFCPDCGTQWLEEKTCPVCGTQVNGSFRFCNECGYSFIEPEAESGNKGEVKKPKQRNYDFTYRMVAVIASIALAVIIIAIICSLSCSGASGINGTYYKANSNGELDKSKYFILNSGKWEDHNGDSGTFKKDGESIVFYYEFFGETVELCSGTISDGVLKVNGNTYVNENYKKDSSSIDAYISSTTIRFVYAYA